MTQKIALVGIGKIALDQHIPAISADMNWELAATVSRSKSVGGVENFETIDAMLEARPDIRVLSLTMPPQPRFTYACKALLAGCHVMLEKPPGASISECLALKETAIKMGVSLFATWHSRCATSVPDAKAWLAERKLKKLTITWKEDVRRWHPGQEWIWEPGGMGVFDPGINALSIMTEILPVPVHVSEAALTFPANRQTPIAAELSFTHPDGAFVSADFDWRQEGPQTWEISAETDLGSLVLSSGGSVLEIDGAPVAQDRDREYAVLYQQMTRLVADSAIDMDLAPLMHVADSFMLGQRHTTEPFEF